MAPIDLAVKEAQEKDQPHVSDVARRHQVAESTLRYRLKHRTTGRLEKHQNQCLLTPIQQKVLVGHINRLTSLGIPPTPAMVTTFAYEIAGKQPGKNWCRRFV